MPPMQSSFRGAQLGMTQPTSVAPQHCKPVRATAAALQVPAGTAAPTTDVPLALEMALEVPLPPRDKTTPHACTRGCVHVRGKHTAPAPAAGSPNETPTPTRVPLLQTVADVISHGSLQSRSVVRQQRLPC